VWLPPTWVLAAGEPNSLAGEWVPNSDDWTNTLVLYIVIPLRLRQATEKPLINFSKLPKTHNFFKNMGKIFLSLKNTQKGKELPPNRRFKTRQQQKIH
jgi:hypothetical protein